MNKINLNQLSLEKQMYIFNKYQYTYSTEKKEGKLEFNYFKRNKLEKVSISESIYIDGEIKEVAGYFKLKDLTRLLHKKRADLSKSNTKQLLAFFKGNRHRHISETDYLFYYGGITSLIAIKKELDKREHIPNKIDGKALRRLCSQKKISKEKALAEFY